MNTKYIDPVVTQSDVRELMNRMRSEIINVIKRYYQDDFSDQQIEMLLEDQLDKICKTWVNSTLYGSV